MANNEYVNRVEYGGTVLIDTSDVTVTEDALTSGATALDKTGKKIEGVNPYVKSTTDDIVHTQSELMVSIAEALSGKTLQNGGTLGIKTGTFYLPGGYGITIQHGCGKLPYAVFVYPDEGKFSKEGNPVRGAVWIRDAYGMMIKGSSKEYFSSVHAQYVVPIEAEGITKYAIRVNKEQILMNPNQAWQDVVFRWIAIYEV